MEEANGNGKWRQKIMMVNLAYLSIAREIGAIPDQRSYAQTALGLDGDSIELLMGLSQEATRKIAEVGGTVFRLKPTDLRSANNLYQKGNGERASSLLAAALAADGKEGGEA